jgi:hypothetical protein
MSGNFTDIEDFESHLNAAANTSDLIAWDKLRERLDAAPAALNDHDFVDLILAAANGRKPSRRQWNQLVGLEILQGGDEQRGVGFPPRVQNRVVVALTVIVNASLRDATSVDKRRLANLRTALATLVNVRVLVSPSWSPRGERRDRIIATDIWGAVAYGLRVLADPSFAHKLCRCKYSGCQKFFLERRADSGRGAPISKYCNAEHRRLGDREESAKRMEQRRREQGIQPRKHR